MSLINDVVSSIFNEKKSMCSQILYCLGKVLQHPDSNEAWKNRVAGVRAERSYRDYDAINGESTEFEWNIFQGFTTLQLCDKVSYLLRSMGQTPESFTGRILVMSMFNDISCDRYDNKDECFSADQDTVDTIYRIFLFVNQLTVYGAVATICEEFEDHQERTGELVILRGQSINCSERSQSRNSIAQRKSHE